MEDRNLEEYKKRKKEAKQRFTAQQKLADELVAADGFRQPVPWIK